MTKTHATADTIVILVMLVVYGAITVSGHDGNPLLLLLGGFLGRAATHQAADAIAARGAA